MIVMEREEKMDRCVFCKLLPEDILAENDLFIAVFDKNPTSKGHTLIISKRHVPNIFFASAEEMAAIGDLLNVVKEILDDRYHPDGYNVGVNVGEVAGQTIFHLHVHVIPRYQGDNDLLKWHVQ
jgi:histidine triad (HIT) family protein